MDKQTLVVDLNKSWREDMHPRDKFGQFTRIGSGSRVVTSTGKSGVVQSSDDTHHKIRFDGDNKVGKVARNNVIHEKDHKKVTEHKKKEEAAAKRRKNAAAKANATKQFNKTNATGAAGKAKPVADPTAAKPAAKKRGASPAAAKRNRDMSAPVYVHTTAHDESAKKVPVQGKITQNKARQKEDPKANEQNVAASEVAELENTPEKKTIDTMWNSAKVQAIMSKPASKRSAEAIRNVAGEMTTANDKLARHVVLKMSAARGLNVAGQVNRIGNASTPAGKVKVQETNVYGDLLQAARASMFETLTSVLSGSQNPGQGTAIGAHVISRMKQKLHRDIYSLMNDIPAPHEVRGAIGDASKAETALTSKLGRTPSHDELAAHLQENSKNFREAPIMQPPVWNEEKGDWEAKDQRIKDPAERLRALQTYAAQQKATSLDQGKTEGGERLNVTDSMADRTGASTEQAYIEKERQQELAGALPKAMKEMGLTDDEIRVMTVKFSNASSTGSKPSLTSKEVAEHLNEHHGMDVSSKWVDNRLMFGMQKVKEARDKDHPALAQLRLFKSLIVNAILKTAYEYDLVKSLHDWGLDTTVLEQTFVRTVYADSRHELLKSLEPHEYVGGLITLDEGEVVAQITELTVPGNNELYKSFGEFANGLKKSMFPHVGGSNNAVNEKAKAYVKANAKKYGSISEQQHASAKGKSGARTWSEELLLKNPGSAWITWGGKRILVSSSTGDILYDSRNETHREDHNQGAQEDKLEFQHEKDAGIDETNAHEHDHGVQAFKHDFMEARRNEWIQKDGKSIVGGVKGDFLKNHAHKALQAYADMSEEDREKLDSHGADRDAKAAHIGNHFMSKPEVKDALRKFKNGELDEEGFKEAVKGSGSAALKNKAMVPAILSELKKHDPDTKEGHNAIAAAIGNKEMTRANEEANKNLLPEGKYMIGNPVTGKTMVVHVGGGFSGGRGSRKKDEEGNEVAGKYTSEVVEAFDPDGRVHEDINTWGDLGRALGYTGKEASDLKNTLVSHANTEADKPFMQKIGDDEYNQHRAKTKVGLQATMLHKEFKLVDQGRDANGDVTHQTFAQKMPDGTTNHISVDAKGMITDPLMQRLLNQRKPVTNEAEVNELMKNAVGNRRWVTAHFGSDIHIGDALGHHIQLEYDGKGAPRIVGGKYDGYRYIDSRDVPKGTTDPATGEPVKALFKNGKLVDRRFSTLNEVPMKAGNPVMYKDGDGYKKGRIHSVEDGTFKVTDGHGHVIGMFKKGDLKPAKQEGRILSDAGTAAVKVSQSGTHRMTVGEAFAGMPPRAQDLFEAALRKAKVNSAFDDNGKLNKELELSDAMHKRLTKVLGRSKAGREMMQKFNSAYTRELELHVPEALRKKVEDEGVRVMADGTARISAGKFEQLRDVFASGSEGGLSLTHDAQQYLSDHFARKDRKPKELPQLRKEYQPSTIASGNPKFDNHYKAQFKGESYLMNPEQGLYGTQLEGVSHLVERGRGIAGHGMGTGKTILGVVAGLHAKADALANGQKPKKTLIVAPKGIMSDWGKEIGSHTNSKALYIGGGSSFKGSKMIDGKKHWGQDGTEQEAVDIRKFKGGSHADGDHDFHIVSYDTFMRNRDHFANSGDYGNIVIDEVHAFKNKQGKRGTALAETTDKFKNVWGLSGTPMENDAREMHSLVDTITGGRHELGNVREFQNNYMKKDKNGKLVGIKPEMAEKLGDILANIVQFRGGEDVTYNDGSKIQFPHLVGKQATGDSRNPNPRVDFIGNMVNRDRDHQTTDYYGTKHSITDFDTATKTVTNKNNGESYDVTTTVPKNVPSDTAAMLSKYKELEAKYLPESKLNELASAAATGIDQGQKGSQNYLTAMQKLQKYLNAPLAHKMYVGGGDALDSDATDAQSAPSPTSEGGKRKKSGLSEGEHYTVDGDGFKRYYESDGKGGYMTNPDGSPRLLPPLHKNNPKAQYLQDRIHTYLDSLQQENRQRVARGEKPLVPKLVVKSSYTTFGTDIVDNVLKDVRASHPIFRDLAKHGYGNLQQGRFTGDADDREDTKVGFRGKKNDYLNNQGHLWATTVSPAGKEGVDFGNAHMMVHFDQDWNPQKMAQFTARVRRSDSAKTHNQIGRANAVRVESLHVPNTVEDFMFNAQDAKMQSIQHVVDNTRTAEANPKLGETQGTIGHGHRGFTSRKQPRKPKAPARPVSKPKEPELTVNLPKKTAEVADKSMKLVIIL